MNHDETSTATRNPPVEGEDAHQGLRGLDTFMRLGETERGASGGVPGEEPSTSTTETPEAERARERRAALAANTWKNRGAELAARVLGRVEGAETPIATPWRTVNERMGGGLWPGMHVVVGGTGTGKSQWAMQVCIEAARAGVPVLVLSLELDALGVFARAASFFTQDLARDDGSALPAVKWSAFYTGGRASTEAQTERDRAAVREALPHVLPKLEALPLHWIEAPPHGLPHTEIAELAADLRALHPEHTGPVVVVVDFLQLVAGTDPREDTITRVSRAAYQCRAVARPDIASGNPGAVVLVLSSTSRLNEKDTRITAREEPSTLPKRGPAALLVGMGKESGDVEFSADSVLVLCPEPPPEDGPDGEKPAKMRGGRPVHLAVAKLRAGVPGWCELRFNGSRFIEAPPTPATGEAWCERCDANRRVLPSRERMMCGACGFTIEEQPDDTAEAPREVTLAPRTGKRKKAAKPSTEEQPDDTTGSTP